MSDLRWYIVIYTCLNDDLPIDWYIFELYPRMFELIKITLWFD